MKTLEEIKVKDFKYGEAVNELSAFLGTLKPKIKELTADDVWSLTQFQVTRMYKKLTGKMPNELK